MFPRKLRRAIFFFFASFFLTVSIASCAGGDTSSVKSLATVSTADIAAPPIPPGKTLLDITATRKV